METRLAPVQSAAARALCNRSDSGERSHASARSHSPALARQRIETRGGSCHQGRRDLGRHRHVRALEAAERTERCELDVPQQLRPEQWRADAEVEPDVGPPSKVVGVRWLGRVLVGFGHDRRDVIDARVLRPRDLQPHPVADCDPIPVARRAPPMQTGGNSGVQVVISRAVLKDPVAHRRHSKGGAERNGLPALSASGRGEPEMPIIGDCRGIWRVRSTTSSVPPRPGSPEAPPACGRAPPRHSSPPEYRSSRTVCSADRP
jgi:hypothetical protein